MTARQPAGVANYPGDVRHMIGEIKGPTTRGGFVVAESAAYYRGHDRTVVSFGHATVDDIDALAAELGVRFGR